MYSELIEQWAREQGFETWASDHATVLRNMAKWMDKSNPHPEAREGAWKHTELANRIEMYVESRLAATKPEGQDARPCDGCKKHGVKNMQECYDCFAASRHTWPSYAPTATEPRSAEELDWREIAKQNAITADQWKREAESLRSQLARKDEGLREALERLVKAVRSQKTDGIESPRSMAVNMALSQADIILREPDGRKGQ